MLPSLLCDNAMLLSLEVIRCFSTMSYVHIGLLQRGCFWKWNLSNVKLSLQNYKRREAYYLRERWSLSINLPSHRFLQHSPEVWMTFMEVVVSCIRHLRQICNWATRFIICFAMSLPETHFPINSRPTGSDKLLSYEVIILQLTSLTKETFKVPGSGDGVTSIYSRSTGNRRPTIYTPLHVYQTGDPV